MKELRGRRPRGLLGDSADCCVAGVSEALVDRSWKDPASEKKLTSQQNGLMGVRASSKATQTRKCFTPGSLGAVSAWMLVFLLTCIKVKIRRT